MKALDPIDAVLLRGGLEVYPGDLSYEEVLRRCEAMVVCCRMTRHLRDTDTRREHVFYARTDLGLLALRVSVSGTPVPL